MNQMMVGKKENSVLINVFMKAIEGQLSVNIVGKNLLATKVIPEGKSDFALSFVQTDGNPKIRNLVFTKSIQNTI